MPRCDDWRADCKSLNIVPAPPVRACTGVTAIAGRESAVDMNILPLLMTSARDRMLFYYERVKDWISEKRQFRHHKYVFLTIDKTGEMCDPPQKPMRCKSSVMFALYKRTKILFSFSFSPLSFPLSLQNSQST